MPEKSSIFPGPLQEILGMIGEMNHGMVKFTIERPAEKHGTGVGNEMAINSRAAFAGSDGNAVLDGDFAVTVDQLESVLKPLWKDDIRIVVMHEQIIHEEPRNMFFHYWRRGAARDLAVAVKKAFLLGGLLNDSSPLPK